jgi:ATP adenylyltransferase
MWAPWRMSYVGADPAERNPGCVFCELPAQADEPAYILHRGRLAYVIMNRYPYNNGHLMIVPFAHVPSLTDLAPEDAAEMIELTRRSQDVVQEAMRPQGFNVGMNQGRAAGAGIEEHLHLHLVPRWVGDTNFMPAIGDTRVMPQHLDETYALLRRGFAA